MITVEQYQAHRRKLADEQFKRAYRAFITRYHRDPRTIAEALRAALRAAGVDA